MSRIREKMNELQREHSLHIYRAALNSCLRVTPPNTIKSARVSGERGAPDQTQVKKLRARIVKQITGEPGEPLRSAIVRQGDNGQAILLDISEGADSMPLVIARNRNHGAQTVDALSYILANTYIKYKKEWGSRRIRRPAARMAVTTAQSWRSAASVLSKRAGHFMGGWSAVAQAIGGSGLNKAIPANATISRGGMVKVTEADGIITIHAKNTQARSKGISRYTQQVLDERFIAEAEYFAEVFSEPFIKAVKKHLKKLILQDAHP